MFRVIRLYTIIVLLFFSNLIFAQRTCKDVRNGVFKTISESGTTIIVRKGSLQTEENETVHFKGEFKIEWLDDCTYTIQPKKIYDKGNLISVDPTEILTIKILKVTNNYYLQKSSSNRNEFVIEGKVFFVD